MSDTPKVDVEESTQYESCIGVKDQQRGSVFEFMDDLSEDDNIGKKFDEPWQEHWVGMPNYVQEDNPPYMKIYVSFRCKEDYAEFSKLVDQNLTEKTKSIWYPKLDREDNALLRWIEE